MPDAAAIPIGIAVNRHIWHFRGQKTELLGDITKETQVWPDYLLGCQCRNATSEWRYQIGENIRAEYAKCPCETREGIEIFARNYGFSCTKF